MKIVDKEQLANASCGGRELVVVLNHFGTNQKSSRCVLNAPCNKTKVSMNGKVFALFYSKSIEL